MRTRGIWLCRCIFSSAENEGQVAGTVFQSGWWPSSELKTVFGGREVVASHHIPLFRHRDGEIQTRPSCPFSLRLLFQRTRIRLDNSCRRYVILALRRVIPLTP
jgi:hypothetical protein